jgi:hypothetical protein
MMTGTIKATHSTVAHSARLLITILNCNVMYQVPFAALLCLQPLEAAKHSLGYTVMAAN